MWPKACKRCGGDLYRREEPEGIEVACMQCSRIYSSQQLISAVPALSDDTRIRIEDGVEVLEEEREPVAA